MLPNIVRALWLKDVNNYNFSTMLRLYLYFFKKNKPSEKIPTWIYESPPLDGRWRRDARYLWPSVSHIRPLLLELLPNKLPSSLSEIWILNTIELPNLCTILIEVYGATDDVKSSTLAHSITVYSYLTAQQQNKLWILKILCGRGLPILK